LPVGLSTIGDLLRYSDPNWLLMLARGLSFILWGIVVSLAIGIIGGLLFQSRAAQHWIEIIASLMGLYGAWLLTEPDPSGLGEAQYATARKLVRAALVVAPASNGLQAMGSMPGMPHELGVGLGIIALGAGVFGVIGEFAKFVYLEKLALRVPHDGLARRARLLRWGFAITLGATVLIGGIMGLMYAFGTQPRAGSNAFMGIARGIAGLAFLVLWVMTIFFYIRMRRALREQVAMAQQVWGQATARAADSSMPTTG
jgi:hypothetical protein